jgi:hypothetical protein
MNSKQMCNIYGTYILEVQFTKIKINIKLYQYVIIAFDPVVAKPSYVYISILCPKVSYAYQWGNLCHRNICRIKYIAPIVCKFKFNRPQWKLLMNAHTIRQSLNTLETKQSKMLCSASCCERDQSVR